MKGKEKGAFHSRVSPKSTRGQGLSTTAIILIVIGIIILVVLVIGFSVGWGKIAPFLSSSNLDSLSTQCSTACTTNSVYDFCSKQRDLNDGTNSFKNVTCYYLAQPQQASYGIASCPSVSCPVVVFNYTATTLDQLKASCNANAGKTVAAMINKALQTYSCPAVSA